MGSMIFVLQPIFAANATSIPTDISSLIIDFNHMRVDASVSEATAGWPSLTMQEGDFWLTSDSAANPQDLFFNINNSNHEMFLRAHGNPSWIDITQGLPFAERLFNEIGNALKDPQGYNLLSNNVNCHWTTAVLNGLVPADHLFDNLNVVINYSEQDYLKNGFGELDPILSREAQLGLVYQVDPADGSLALVHSFTVVPGTDWVIQKEGFGGNNPFSTSTASEAAALYQQNIYRTVTRFFTKDPVVLSRHPQPAQWSWQQSIVDQKAFNTSQINQYSAFLGKFPTPPAKFFTPYDPQKDALYATPFGKAYFEFTNHYAGQKLTFLTNPKRPFFHNTWYEFDFANAVGTEFPIGYKKVKSPTKQYIGVSSQEDALRVFEEIEMSLLLYQLIHEQSIYADYKPNLSFQGNPPWVDPVTDLVATVEIRNNQPYLVLTPKSDPNIVMLDDPFPGPLEFVALALDWNNSLGIYSK